MPVVYPGYSAHNMPPFKPRNEIPRQCGSFYWRQVENAVEAGAITLFVAMFDEVDEGTAMFKLVPTPDGLPGGSNLIPLDIDGCQLPSDFYLRLGTKTGQALRGEISPSGRLPFSPFMALPRTDHRRIPSPGPLSESDDPAAERSPPTERSEG